MNKTLYLIFVLVTTNSFAQKIFHQPSESGIWQYIYPFKNKDYILAIQYLITEKEPLGELCYANSYFGKRGVKADKIFWEENIEMRHVKDNITYEDYNNDGIKDLLIFEDTGARGGNSFYNLYLVNPKTHTLTRVKDFDKIVNPSYDQKHKVIVSYGLTGTNYYQLYKLDKKHILYKIGEPFDDTDNLNLDKETDAVLKKNNNPKPQLKK
ncbi:hypothetical protein HDC90_004666 [Pedobacter sp. AK013]|uniref:XAC2610-related protein n=1 Tax=Pedobacter sp. AK013 TaxID=2723071 RepID=UPI0016151F87|nr:hypothetical protein [Pedobacter sp. AK013]MBB6240004.1 hypothetical protein [Pedobacter sp. AK013]